jgi:hypothetical protein
MSEQHQNLIRTIEKQRARIEALEAALRAIAEVCRTTTPNRTVLTTIHDCARAALAPEQDK